MLHSDPVAYLISISRGTYLHNLKFSPDIREYLTFVSSPFNGKPKRFTPVRKIAKSNFPYVAARLKKVK